MTITTSGTTAPVRSTRRIPTGFFALELRRVLRNRRTLIFTLLMPPLFFVVFGSRSEYRVENYGSGNVTAYVMVSMAVYGAMLATTSGGATVAIERALGWSRQLRLTPLTPLAYVTTKIAVSLVLGLASVLVVFITGAFTGAHLSPAAWVGCFVAAWLGSSVFAAFGLFVGYLLPSENVMQVIGPLLAILAFAGGLFVPPSGWFATVSTVFPTYGVAALARSPLGDVDGGTLAGAVVNLVVWAVLFVTGAVLLYRRDAVRGQ